MYIIKNAFKSISRSKGRNILIGVIVAVISLASCVALAINSSADNLIASYKDNNLVAISFTPDMESARANSSGGVKIDPLTVEQIEEYGQSDLVSDYSYTAEVTVSAVDMSPVSINGSDSSSSNNNGGVTTSPGGGGNMMRGPQGDYRLTGYSDPGYIEEFVNGTRKMKDGKMFESGGTASECLISSELAALNNLSVGDTIKAYAPVVGQDTTYDLEIIGIFDDSSDETSNSFANSDALNPKNQIITPVSNVTEINEAVQAKRDQETADMPKGAVIMAANNVNAKYYLKPDADITQFENEAREKGLPSSYKATTNESETEQSLRPVESIRSLSITFLFIVLIIGAIILAVINMINIRERKYEIGVLRAVGMSKFKVATQLISEIFIVAIIALVIGTGIGGAVSQPVASSMLQSEISAQKEGLENNQQNFGGQGFTRQGMGGKTPMMIGGSVDYIDTLAVNVGADTIMKLILEGLALTVISGAISVLFIAKYEPIKILRDRS